MSTVYPSEVRTRARAAAAGTSLAEGVDAWFHDELKKRGLPASGLLQIALRAELERHDALDETARYLEELAAEVGEPSTRQQSQADGIARRIRDRSLDRVS